MTSREPKIRRTTQPFRDTPSPSPLKVSQSLALLCLKENLADVHFLVGDEHPQRIPGHKLVLGARSDVFEALLYGHMKESRASHGDIVVADVTPEAFRNVLQYVYTDHCEHITVVTVTETLYAAKKYAIDGLAVLCVEFLRQQLNVRTATAVLEAALLYEDEQQLAADALAVIEDATQDVLASPEFLALSEEAVALICGSSLLRISEEDLFAACMRWAAAECTRRGRDASCNHNIRSVLAPSILPHIRFALFPREQLPPLHAAGVVTEDEWSSSCPALSSAAVQPLPVEPRRTAQPSLYAVGGWDGQQRLRSVERFDEHTGEWVEVASLVMRRASFGAAAVDGKMYAIGGSDGVSRVAVVERYETRTNSWRQLSTLQQSRCDLAVTAWDGMVFAVGGHDGRVRVATCEIYDTRDSDPKWVTVTPMRRKRGVLAASTLNDSVYAVGGHDGSTYLGSVECYDIASDRWYDCAHMRQKRSSFGVVAQNGALYALGGHDGDEYSNTVERWDPRTPQWEYVASMPTPRASHGAGAIGDRIFVAGGLQSDDNPLSSCEQYDARADAWITVRAMEKKRNYVAVAVL